MIDMREMIVMVTERYEMGRWNGVMKWGDGDGMVIESDRERSGHMKRKLSACTAA